MNVFVLQGAVSILRKQYRKYSQETAKLELEAYLVQINSNFPLDITFWLPCIC